MKLSRVVFHTTTYDPATGSDKMVSMGGSALGRSEFEGDQYNMTTDGVMLLIAHAESGRIGAWPFGAAKYTVVAPPAQFTEIVIADNTIVNSEAPTGIEVKRRGRPPKNA